MDQPFLRKRVLLIDDEAYIREIYNIELTREGFDVLLAVDGDEGLATIRREKPDAILLDLKMPGKNGLEVLKELSSDENLKHIPVIILSNVDEEETFKQVGKFETHFFLVKVLTTPIKVAKILREVIK